MKKKDDYIRRQVYIMSNLGIFYIIIVGFFAVPLLGAFVVVLIKGVVDLRYFIIIGGVLLSVIALYALIKFLQRMFRKIRQDGFAANQEIKEKMGQGEPVQISVFNGLLTLNYGGRQHTNALPFQENPALPNPMTEKQQQPSDLVTQIRGLADLREKGVITEDEFQKIKAKLINASEK
ncbi:SHOCT domain-containing protein [Desulfococcaceae bacterium HSG8]|nr:SHOCT domain-containing protein [Desulfococcaceae bacterium HSG8]